MADATRGSLAALGANQRAILRAMAEESAARAALTARYRARLAPALAARSAALAAHPVDGFWATALAAHPLLAAAITPRDAAVLAHLVDVRDEYPADAGGGGGGGGVPPTRLLVPRRMAAAAATRDGGGTPPSAFPPPPAPWTFALHFHFRANPYFTNGVLTKTYTFSERGPVSALDHADLLHVGGTPIDWAPGKNVTVKVLRRGRGGRGGGAARRTV
ncbi:hypothetical protein BU14_0075s0015 [Porphyra umbilicalis]|uniref:Nucleosome assembly protein n=1 Tax=Porphyra umbilicalis TaxID=2786 RepID=A0A1X6PFJ7_PORUM|nr:hypothetical protein BU14_0075s0015 [Porphyra umbilicalis]|eukprot:OSX79525.1 hypothetical protein BU14_0075s0015 [Porphyra umbilicalis]